MKHKMKSLKGFSASKQARAHQVLSMANAIPELSAAYLSHNNRDFRIACIKIARLANDEEAALKLLGFLPCENWSAALKFAADCIDGITAGNEGEKKVGKPLNISELLSLPAQPTDDEEDSDEEESPDDDGDSPDAEEDDES